MFHVCGGKALNAESSEVLRGVIPQGSSTGDPEAMQKEGNQRE
jgi:hypothetical protein